LCPIPGTYAVTSIPLVRRTRAILRIAEFGFFGVLVVTLTQTPLLKGDGKNFGLFFIALKVRVKAIDFDFRLKRFRDDFVN
jgi:hypothetical protein